MQSASIRQSHLLMQWRSIQLRLQSTRSAAPKVSEPLRILFCGSDEFSCASIEALHDEQARNNALIESIDVLVRPPKPSGRNNRIIQKGALHHLAERLSLPIHQRDTFTGWSPPTPQPPNLIIAVSFGLFVPRRLLSAAAYGGLNVHPSLLPDLRGAAPIQRALLARRRVTGVSLQTLSPAAFDTGAVLARRAAPVPEKCAVERLRGALARIGARLLVRALRKGLHVPPLAPLEEDGPGAGRGGGERGGVGGGRGVGGGEGGGEFLPSLLLRAPKITKDDSRVVWAGAGAFDASEFELRARVLGSIWTVAVARDGAERRLIFEGVEALADDQVPEQEKRIIQVLAQMSRTSFGSNLSRDVAHEAGEDLLSAIFMEPRTTPGDDTEQQQVKLPWVSDGEAIVIRTTPGEWVRVKWIKVEGDRSRPALKAIGPFTSSFSSK